MPVATKVKLDDSTLEKVLWHRSMADLHARVKTADGLDRALLHLRAADRMEWEHIRGKAIADYLRSGSENPSNEFERKALSTLRDDAGGFLVPTVAPAEILAKGLSDYNPIRDYATVVTLTAGDLYPQPVEKTRPGVRWVRETDSRQTPTSDMVLSGEGVPVHIVNATVPVSSKLRDSAAYDPDIFVIQPVMRSFLVAESKQFVIGNGIGQPEGIFTNGSVPVIKSGSNSTITADAVQAVFYALHNAFRKNASWMMNDATIQVVKTLKDSTGAYLYERGLFGLSPETLLGRPIISCPDAPTIAASAWPIAFGDVSRYVIVDRTQLAVLVDPYSSKPSFVYDCIRRVGGQVVDATAFVKMVIST